MARRTPSQLNMLLAVDKPVGCTSHDVVSQCRRALHERRVGHAGTLDPMASGVMVVGVGQASRLLGMLTLDTKSYVADISFGVETNTDDAEGEAVRSVPVTPELRDLAYAREQLAAMLGPQLQVPPAFSAISVNGVRAYKSARAGNAVELPPRPVEVYAADLIAVGGEGDTCAWTVAFSVSRGTGIRALARDLGRACESAAHISALRRTASGVVSIGACHAVEELSPESAAGFALDPIAALDATRVDLPGNLRIPVERALADFDASKAPFALVLDGIYRRSPALRAAASSWSTCFRRQSAVFDDVVRSRARACLFAATRPPSLLPIRLMSEQDLGCRFNRHWRVRRRSPWTPGTHRSACP